MLSEAVLSPLLMRSRSGKRIMIRVVRHEKRREMQTNSHSTNSWVRGAIINHKLTHSIRKYADRDNNRNSIRPDTTRTHAMCNIELHNDIFMNVKPKKCILFLYRHYLLKSCQQGFKRQWILLKPGFTISLGRYFKSNIWFPKSDFCKVVQEVLSP